MEAYKQNNDEVRGPEQIGEKNIAVFGAQGHLGHLLVDRLNEINPGGAKITPVTKRAENKEAAFRSDLVVLTVRPDQVHATLFGIRQSIAPPAQVLSFAAGVPLEDISGAVRRPAARMMTDPWWNTSAFVLGDQFSKEGYEFLFNNLTRMKSIQLKDDASIDRYTLLLCQVFVALLLDRMGELKFVDRHLQFVAAQKEFKCDSAEFKKFVTGPDPAEALRTLATPGGVTERFLNVTRRKGANAKPADILLEVTETLKHADR